MTIVERQELQEALARIEARFAKSDEDADLFRKEVRADVSAIKDDISRIKGMARPEYADWAEDRIRDGQPEWSAA